MTPGARLQAAIDLLDQIASSRQSADQILRAWGGANRYAGSKDRRAVADRVYLCLRQPPRPGQDGRGRVLTSLMSHDGLDEAGITALFTGEGHAPAPLSTEEQAALTAPPPAALPAFLEAQLEQTLGQAQAIGGEGRGFGAQ